jgi:large subunit ribosomal protein L19
MTDFLSVVSPDVANREVPEIRSGDTVRLEVRIVEGQRERLQPFQGTVIRMRKTGAGPVATIRRVASHGIGVERSFPLLSPRLAKIEVLRHAKVRRKQLFFLRDRVGKKARLR